VYSKGFRAEGRECRECGSYSVADSDTCVLCAGTLQPVPGFIDRLSQGVMEMGGKVEVVNGEAAEKLSEVGSIAALLRY
jgi:hypothetical protein